jgi:hypothetical protein
MITLRCTKKLLKYLEVDPIDEPSSSTGRLGDWYANLVPTYAGDLIMFVNEKTLITVAVPTLLDEELISSFRSRVLNLLLMLEIPVQQIEQEINHYHEVEYARTASRSVLGSMNDIAFNYQFIAERGVDEGPLSLSDAEYKLSNMPSISRDFFPADVARVLLKKDSRKGSAS